MNNVYLNGRSSWYKAKLDKLSGHTYAELLEAITNNTTMTDPSPKLVKAFKMKRNKNTYTLTADIKDQKLMKDAADPILELRVKVQLKKKFSAAFKNTANTKI